MKPYPAYKESGVPWIGEVPEEWKSKRLKYCLELVTDKNVMKQSNKVALENIESWTGRYLETSSEFAGDGVAFKQDDILFGKLRPYLAKVWLAEFEGNAVGDIFVYRSTEEIMPRFAFYRFISRDFIDIVNGSTFGAKMPRASSEFIGNLDFVYPPLPEQRAIAAYLDRKTAQIDALIANKRRRLALLAEHCTALISHAVTKGLDPAAPLKESGFPWIGEIPEHWSLPKIGQLMYLGRGRVISHIEIQDNPGPYPVYSSQTQNNGIMGYLDTFDFEGDYVTWTTDGANAGTVFFRSGKFNCTNVCGTMQPKGDAVYLPYFPYLLNLGTRYYVRYDINPKLMNGQMARIPICLPPFSEQRAIVAYLDEKTAQIDRAVARTERQIARLEEYRTALISAAVTGKIDVRQEVTP